MSFHESFKAKRDKPLRAECKDVKLYFHILCMVLPDANKHADDLSSTVSYYMTVYMYCWR